MPTVAQERPARTKAGKTPRKPPVVLTEGERRRRAEHTAHDLAQAKEAAVVDAERAAFRWAMRAFDDPKSLFVLVTEAVASGETGHAFLEGALRCLGDDLDALYEAMIDDSGHFSSAGKIDPQKLPDMIYRLSMRARAVVEIAVRHHAVRALEAAEVST